MFELNPLGGASAGRLPASHVQTGLKKFGQAMLIVLVPLAAASGYRAWFQVWSLDVTVRDSTVRRGSVITVSTLTSGRVHVDVRLELLQHGRVFLLGTDRVRTRPYPEMDPRPRRGVMTVAVTDAMARQWQRGPAMLRATANGRSQFIRVPPPEVREMSVSLDDAMN